MSDSASPSSVIPPAPTTHESLNFHLPAKERRCFYEKFERDNLKRNIVVFVQDGGDMDVLLTSHGPLEYEQAVSEDFEDPIRTDFINPKKEKLSDTQTYVAEFEAPEIGLYGFCLDNRKARFFPKIVQIDIQNPAKKGGLSINVPNKTAGEDNEELKESLKALAKIHKGILNIQQQQQRDRHRLALHSATNEKNYDNVYYGSLLETVVFVVVALFQIFFVRRWFASKISKPKNRV